ncbi:hypothetical protein [Sphingobacterium mizutaii]|uniref:hypothetical protein n=1 Tax=Sphingobacterium mizutaii TaxID=1010 RepID=UPI00162331E5|nr:hypothetical protein [Sphingobacterium mizutaii]
MEDKLKECHLLKLNDYFLTRLKALERKANSVKPKPVNSLKKDKKTVKKIKRTSQNRKANVYDKIYEMGGIGKLIYIGKKS